MSLPRNLLPLLLAFAPALQAAQTVVLPTWACNASNDRIFRSGLQFNEWVPSTPSLGSGGAAPNGSSRRHWKRR